MTIQGTRNNPFQLPQLGQKPAQQNPFGNPSRAGGSPTFTGGKPPQDGLGLFKTQMQNKDISPDLSKPKPPRGSGQRLFAMG